MRDDEVINYFNPTIGTHPGVGRDDSMRRPLTREDSGAGESLNGNYNNGNNGIIVEDYDTTVPHTHM